MGPRERDGDTRRMNHQRDADTPRMNRQTFSVEYQVEPLHPAVWGPPRPISQSRYINGELSRDELICLSDAELQKYRMIQEIRMNESRRELYEARIRCCKAEIKLMKMKADLKEREWRRAGCAPRAEAELRTGDGRRHQRQANRADWDLPGGNTHQPQRSPYDDDDDYDDYYTNLGPASSVAKVLSSERGVGGGREPLPSFEQWMVTNRDQTKVPWMLSGNDDRANTRSITSKTEAGLGTDSRPMALGASGHPQPHTPAQWPNSLNLGNQTFVDLTRIAEPAVSVNVNDTSQTETEAIRGDSGRVNLSDD